MAMISRLNGLQQMMLRWEEFHPFNAIHVVQLGASYPVDEIERAIAACCGAMGLGPIAFRSFRTSIAFLAEGLDQVGAAPPFVHLKTDGPAFSRIASIANEQINQPFPDGPHLPIRFCLLESAQDGQFLFAVYQHAISDSRGISIVLRELIRRLQGRSPLIPRLDVCPPSLQTLFPTQFGWSAWPRRWGQAVGQAWIGSGCIRPSRRPGVGRQIECGVAVRPSSTEQLKSTCRELKVKVHTAASAAYMEALALHWSTQIDRGRRKSVSIYTPVDLRREADGRLDSAMGQLLGAVISHATIANGTDFCALAREVEKQFTEARMAFSHYSHLSHLQLMARVWDCLPRVAKEHVLPALFSQTGFLSNVDLSEFLKEELDSQGVLSYHRFSGTGIMTPMMLAITTLGTTYHLTSTHRADVWETAEMQRIFAHVQWRLDGNVDEPASRERFESHDLECSVVPES